MSAIDASTLSTTSFVTCMSGMEKWDFTWSCWGAGWGPGSRCPEHVGGVSGRSVAGSAGGGSARHRHRERELPAGAPWLLIPATQTWILSKILHPECFLWFEVNKRPDGLYQWFAYTCRTNASCRARYMAICASWGSKAWALREKDSSRYGSCNCVLNKNCSW